MEKELAIIGNTVRLTIGSQKCIIDKVYPGDMRVDLIFSENGKPGRLENVSILCLTAET